MDNEIKPEPPDRIFKRLGQMPFSPNYRKRAVNQPSKCPTGKGRAWNDEVHGWVFVSETVSPITEDDIFRVNREDLTAI